MNKRDREDLFRFLIRVDTRVNELEALHKQKTQSLEARVEALTIINDWAEAQTRNSKREATELRDENTRLRNKLQRAENERDVARKELEIARDHARFIEQDRDALDIRVRETDNQRKRMRKSYNELQRNLDSNLRTSEAMIEWKNFLMN